MSENTTTTIQLPVFSDNEHRGYETLPVEAVTTDTYRLLASPGFVEGVAAGDVVTLTPDQSRGYVVVQRANNLCVWIYFDHDIDQDEAQTSIITRQIEQVGGWLDGGSRALLVYTVPVSVGFQCIEKLLDQFIAQGYIAEWLYGNVYDPNDGETPLGWWQRIGE